jgi:hypothetical protein
MGNAMNDPFENSADVEPEKLRGGAAQARQTKIELKKQLYE